MIIKNNAQKPIPLTKLVDTKKAYLHPIEAGEREIPPTFYLRLAK